ncbi:cystathionine gamma-synthase family protein [Glaciecola petra]|uniref:Cystathionine gamma-synthase family protein n=1 Tax=Glaciecola petra TaxID=3075602 RepID=A0ABU2ZP06_9ALTE|nr:cystathionine gamma-synthase family protein [Aestuariibacter sp. P117]MDT0594358.1 cystathionine gamma-synthase family protein [Aestuariibacter sp. P117]
MKRKKLDSELVHADRQVNLPQSGAVHEASNNSVLFHFDDVADLEAVFQGKKNGHVYSRSSSSSSVALQNILAKFESGKYATVFSTGMAAISALMFSLLKSGDHIVVSKFLFGNTRSFIDSLMRFGIDVDYIDTTKVDNLAAVVKHNTKMVFCESIANPGTQVADLKNIGDYCASNSLLFVLDNTMTPCVLLDAKAVKANLLTTSLTKYVSGHGNVLGGVVVDMGNFDWTGFDNIYDVYKNVEPDALGTTQIRKKGLRDIGATLAAQSAHLISTGLETLSMRMMKICENALKVSQFLATHNGVTKVLYPGLPEHQQHVLAKELFNGNFGGILSFELDASIDVRSFINALDMILSATHLGDNRTLILPVASTIFYENGPEQREEMGISDTLIRMSLGIENADDIIQDLTQALHM